LLCVRREPNSLNAALYVMTGPLDLACISLELELVLSSLAVLEPQDAAVFANEHHPGAGFNFLACEVANTSFWHGASPCVEFAGFSTRVLEHQNITDSNGANHVSTDDATDVPGVRSIVNTDLDLRGLACHTGSADDFDHFCWPSTKFFAHGSSTRVHFLRALMASTTSWNFS